MHLKRALVVSTGKNSAWISIEGEDAPRVAQLRRMTGKRYMPVPGDVVHVRILEDGRTVVDRLEPRAFSLERRTAEGRSKTMAANVDTLATVTALAHPEPRTITLDQLLAFAELAGIAAGVILTKPDLAPGDRCETFVRLYEGLEYPTLVVDPKHGANVSSLQEYLHGRHALLCGNSGVGKSTIFRALGGESTVGEVSRHGLGRQTTTAARLCRLGDGFLIDSPGVNEFGLGAIGPQELAGAFREMRDLTASCRFTDCTHLQEPGCAIRSAVGGGIIAQSRYDSFVKIVAGAAGKGTPAG